MSGIDEFATAINMNAYRYGNVIFESYDYKSRRDYATRFKDWMANDDFEALADFLEGLAATYNRPDLFSEVIEYLRDENRSVADRKQCGNAFALGVHGYEG